MSELEKLRSILEVFTKGQYDDIIVAGVKTGCVIVTLLIRNCLIPKLRKLYTSEKSRNDMSMDAEASIEVQNHESNDPG